MTDPAISPNSSRHDFGWAAAHDGTDLPARVWSAAGLVLLLWGGAVAALAAAGVFVPAPNEPPAAVLVAALVPPALFWLALRASAGLRAAVLAIPLALLTAMQGWRVVGAAFLMLYGIGQLPGAFAWPAGLGDVMVGLAAPFAVLVALRRGPGWKTRLYWFNATGLLDFVVALGSGALTSGVIAGLTGPDGLTSALTMELPLVLIPAFAVPVFIILHLIAVMQIRRAPETAELTG